MHPLRCAFESGLADAGPIKGSTPWKDRVPASQHTPEALRDLIDGKLVSSDARSELIELAAQVIIEEALEAERGRPGDRPQSEGDLSPAGLTGDVSVARRTGQRKVGEPAFRSSGRELSVESSAVDLRHPHHVH